jgi:hypothetical protein
MDERYPLFDKRDGVEYFCLLYRLFCDNMNQMQVVPARRDFNMASIYRPENE